MNRIKEWLEGKKTYFVCISALIGIVIAWSTGDMTGLAAVQAAVAAIVGMTIRAGIAKAKI